MTTAPDGTATATRGASDALLVIGYIAAVLMPPIGFVIGVVAIAKGRTGHGVAVMAVSLLLFVLALNRYLVGG